MALFHAVLLCPVQLEYLHVAADGTWNPGESSVILIKVPKSFHQHRGPPTHPTYPVEEVSAIL